MRRLDQTVFLFFSFFFFCSSWIGGVEFGYVKDMGSRQQSGGRFNLLQVFSPQPASTFLHRLVADAHDTVQRYDVSTSAPGCKLALRRLSDVFLCHGMAATCFASALHGLTVGDGRDTPQGCSGYAHAGLGCGTPPLAPR
jgi:hypothetical protein